MTFFSISSRLLARSMDSIKCSKCGKEVNPTDEVCPHCGYIFNEPQEENNQINTKPPRKPLFNKRDYLLFWGGSAGLSTVPLILCIVSKEYYAASIFGFVSAVFLLIFFIVLFNEK